MNEVWWGRVTLPTYYSLQLDMGSLMLAVQHKKSEWYIYYQQETEIDINKNKLLKAIGQFSPCNYQEKVRFIVNDDVDVIEIMPALADRAVVCRPSTVIDIAPGAQTVLYITTPVWLTISLLRPNLTLLKEIASQRLSDTWFGHSTMEGELCYASTTSGRVDLEKLPHRIQRVTTALIIKNLADTNLVFERVSIPVPLLSIFSNKMGQLWTESVTLTREDDGELARLKIGRSPSEAQLVTKPRVKNNQHELFRAFSAIFN